MEAETPAMNAEASPMMTEVASVEGAGMTTSMSERTMLESFSRHREEREEAANYQQDQLHEIHDEKKL